MNYCKSCNLACEDISCPRCGKRKLREIKDNDYCFVKEVFELEKMRLEAYLKENEIPLVFIPYVEGAGSFYTFRPPVHKMYVPFHLLKKTMDIMKALEEESNAALKAQMIEDAPKINIDVKYAKKLAKKLKLPSDMDILNYCREIILNADRVADRSGEMGFGEQAIYVYANNVCLIVSTFNYEILTVKKIK